MTIAIVLLSFIVGVGLVLALAQFAGKVPGMLMQRKLESRLQELSRSNDVGEETSTVLLKTLNSGPLPALDRAFASGPPRREMSLRRPNWRHQAHCPRNTHATAGLHSRKRRYTPPSRRSPCSRHHLDRRGAQ